MMTFMLFNVDTYHLSISESSPVGTTVGHIKAVDADIGRNAEVRYRITDGDEMGMFEVTTERATQEGAITVRKVCNVMKHHKTNKYVIVCDNIVLTFCLFDVSED